MTQEKVNLFIAQHGKHFPEGSIYGIKEKLLKFDDSKSDIILCADFKEPTTMLILSVLLGSFGIDRFMLGDTGMGVLKLLTGGLCGILTIVDWFTIGKKTKENNYAKLMQLLTY